MYLEKQLNFQDLRQPTKRMSALLQCQKFLVQRCLDKKSRTK